jgi:type IV pilus assembly protein PilM
MLVAARKEKIDERIALAKAVGLEVVAINVDSYAARFALSDKIKREKHGKNNAIGLFHIGSEHSHFSVIVNRATVYERELGLGNQKLKQDLQRYTDDMQAEIIQPFNEMLAQELNRSLQLFFSSSAYTQLGHL